MLPFQSESLLPSHLKDEGAIIGTNDALRPCQRSLPRPSHHNVSQIGWRDVAFADAFNHAKVLPLNPVFMLFHD